METQVYIVEEQYSYEEDSKKNDNRFWMSDDYSVVEFSFN